MVDGRDAFLKIRVEVNELVGFLPPRRAGVLFLPVRLGNSGAEDAAMRGLDSSP